MHTSQDVTISKLKEVYQRVRKCHQAGDESAAVPREDLKVLIDFSHRRAVTNPGCDGIYDALAALAVAQNTDAIHHAGGISEVKDDNSADAPKTHLMTLLKFVGAAIKAEMVKSKGSEEVAKSKGEDEKCREQKAKAFAPVSKASSAILLVDSDDDGPPARPSPPEKFSPQPTPVASPTPSAGDSGKSVVVESLSLPSSIAECQKTGEVCEESKLADATGANTELLECTDQGRVQDAVVSESIARTHEPADAQTMSASTVADDKAAVVLDASSNQSAVSNSSKSVEISAAHEASQAVATPEAKAVDECPVKPVEVDRQTPAGISKAAKLAELKAKVLKAKSELPSKKDTPMPVETKADMPNVDGVPNGPAAEATQGQVAATIEADPPAALTSVATDNAEVFDGKTADVLEDNKGAADVSVHADVLNGTDATVPTLQAADASAAVSLDACISTEVGSQTGQIVNGTKKDSSEIGSLPVSDEAPLKKAKTETADMIAAMEVALAEHDGSRVDVSNGRGDDCEAALDTIAGSAGQVFSATTNIGSMAQGSSQELMEATSHTADLPEPSEVEGDAKQPSLETAPSVSTEPTSGVKRPLEATSNLTTDDVLEPTSRPKLELEKPGENGEHCARNGVASGDTRTSNGIGAAAEVQDKAVAPSPAGLDGRWDRGIIDGANLNWNDGKVDQLSRTSETTLEFTQLDRVYHAELWQDKLYWSDGDIWIRMGTGDDEVGGNRQQCQGLPAEAEVVRIDPDDNEAYTFSRLFLKYAAHFGVRDVATYWDTECLAAADAPSTN